MFVTVSEVQLNRAKEATKSAVLMNLESRVCSVSLSVAYSSCSFVHVSVFLVIIIIVGSIFADDHFRRYRQTNSNIWREVCLEYTNLDHILKCMKPET